MAVWRNKTVGAQGWLVSAGSKTLSGGMGFHSNADVRSQRLGVAQPEASPASNASGRNVFRRVIFISLIGLVFIRSLDGTLARRRKRRELKKTGGASTKSMDVLQTWLSHAGPLLSIAKAERKSANRRWLRRSFYPRIFECCGHVQSGSHGASLNVVILPETVVRKRQRSASNHIPQTWQERDVKR